MCGLVGSVGGSIIIDFGLDELQARGPDGRGKETLGDTTHGHVRLAIMGGHGPLAAQPVTGADFLMSYAGECWNVETLRTELGVYTQSGGDTSLVARAFQRWGPHRALQLIEGMFAVAWTTRDGTWIARDRIGKVPLYLWRNPESGGAAWAVERKALGGVGGLATPVKPGTIVNVKTGEATPYYDVVPSPTPDLDRVRRLVLYAVRRHLAMDPGTPVAVSLSGGLDSSLVAAIAVHEGVKLTAYVARHGANDPDLLAARAVASDLCVDLVEVACEDTPTAEELMETIECIELGNRVAVDIAVVSRRLAKAMQRDGMKVVLTGDGADELFGGYGNLARKASSDEAWTAARLYFYRKLSRSDFPRANKAFLSYGVEPRAPLSDRILAEEVLGLSRKQCPPGKKLLMAVAEDQGLSRMITRRKKSTFQGALAAKLDARRQQTYNAMLRVAYGALVKG